MSDLSQQKCEACRADAPKVSDEELAGLMRLIPEWQPVVIEGVLQLKHEFKFKNFKNAMAFSNRLADLAEEEGHHPGIFTEWGKVTVTWWSHSIRGLHRNDFIMAAKTDALFEG